MDHVQEYWYNWRISPDLCPAEYRDLLRTQHRTEYGHWNTETPSPYIPWYSSLEKNFTTESGIESWTSWSVCTYITTELNNFLIPFTVHFRLPILFIVASEFVCMVRFLSLPWPFSSSICLTFIYYPEITSSPIYLDLFGYILHLFLLQFFLSLN